MDRAAPLPRRRRGRPAGRRRPVSAEPDTEDRRAQIIRGAAAVLARQGYEATSMKEIADEVGVSSGLLHYYFGTKEDLLAEVVRVLHDEQVAEWRQAIAAAGGPLGRGAAGGARAPREIPAPPRLSPPPLRHQPHA